MHSISTFNRSWAKVIVNALVRHGVKHFCIAPGSRSTPLTLEAVTLNNQGLATCHSHFDERGLGFFALGIAKASNAPVAVIVTSGTAVANLLPAVIEASMNHHPLIILSADRPLELIDCGANQAIKQEGIFGDYPTACVNLPKASDHYSPNWLVATIEQGCTRQRQFGGVLHINAPFAEPLYEADEELIDNHPWLMPIQRWLNQPQQKWIDQQTIFQEVPMHENWDFWRTKRGVVVVGKLPLEQGQGLKMWAEALGWCLITDIQSGIAPNLPYADIWLSNTTVKNKLLQADIVVQFGTQIISKRVNQFLSEYRGEFWLVDENPNYQNPFTHRQTRFVTKAHHFIRQHPQVRQKPWILESLALSNFCGSFIESQAGGKLNEIALIHHLDRILPNDGNLFLGNSLLVRLVDALYKSSDAYPVYTNRGASGIDGLIATMAGIAVGSELPTVGLIGDISALHDLNSLALLKKVQQPSVLFIINNGGGEIFDMLPVDETIKNDYYRLSHNFEFRQAAMMFGIECPRPFTWADLSTQLKQAYNRKGVTIFEIRVNENDSSDTYKFLLQRITHAVVG